MSTGKDEPIQPLPHHARVTLRSMMTQYPIVSLLQEIADIVEETSSPPETGATLEEERRYFVASQLRDVHDELVKGGNGFTYDMGYAQALRDMTILGRPRYDLAAIENGEQRAPYFQGYLAAYKGRDGR